MAPVIPEDIRKEIEKKGGLGRILNSLPSRKELEKKAKIHSALGDPFRLKILCFLGIQSSCVCLLRDIANISYSKLSYHLSILKNSNLIEGKKRGNYVIYSLTPQGMRYYEELCKKE